MKRKLTILGTAVCMMVVLLCGVNVYAAGYDVLSETDIIYQKEETKEYINEDTDEYWKTRSYSTLISNFSNGFSVVYENCVEQTNEFVYFTTVESSYVIDEKGNRVEIGDYETVGVTNIN